MNEMNEMPSMCAPAHWSNVGCPRRTNCSPFARRFPGTRRMYCGYFLNCNERTRADASSPCLPVMSRYSLYHGRNWCAWYGPPVHTARQSRQLCLSLHHYGIRRRGPQRGHWGRGRDRADAVLATLCRHYLKHHSTVSTNVVTARRHYADIHNL